MLQVIKGGSVSALAAAHGAILDLSRSIIFNGSQAVPDGIYTIQNVGAASENNPACGTYLATESCFSGIDDLRELTNANGTYLAWNITGLGGNTYNIRGMARQTCKDASNLFGSVPCGQSTDPASDRVETSQSDDGSGRQQVGAPSTKAGEDAGTISVHDARPDVHVNGDMAKELLYI